MGKYTISMAIFNSYVKLPEGNSENMDNYYGSIFEISKCWQRSSEMM